MSIAYPPRTFPAAYFLHSGLTSPKALQSLLAAPHLLKVRKAWLPGHRTRPDGSVVPSGFGFGEWENQDEIQGVVLYVSCQEEEDKLRKHIGEVEPKDVDLQVCMGGMWGTREWTVGRVFVSKEMEKSVRSGVSEESAMGVEHEMYALRDALHITEPSAGERVENVSIQTAPLKTSKPKRMALLRRITEPLRLRANVLESNFAQAGFATNKGDVPVSTNNSATQKDLGPERSSELRHHPDFVTSKLSVLQDSHGQEDQSGDEMSDVLPERVTQKESNVDLESFQSTPPCPTTELDESARVPTIIIERDNGKVGHKRNAEPTMPNTLLQEAAVECEVQDHDVQPSSPSKQDTANPQPSNAISLDSILDKGLPESEEISPSPLRLLESQNENEVVERHADNKNTAVKRTSWNPWDLLQRLQLRPSRDNEESTAQEKDVEKGYVEEQKSPTGVRGLVAMYEMLKK